MPFLVGTMVFKHKEILKERVALIACVSGIIFLTMNFNWTYEMADYPLMYLYKYLSPANWPEAVYPIFLYGYKIIMGISGSLFIISIFIYLSQYIPSNKMGKLLGKWGTLTLGIYLLQAIILEHIMMKTINLSSMEWYLFNYVVSPAISVAVLGVCIVLTELLKRYRWSAFFFLGIANFSKKNTKG